jgi:hypothetical protein
MLWIREAEVFSEVDDASAGQRCRDLDLDGIAGYVCRENPEAAPHLFCHYLCLGLRLAMARLPLDSAQDHWPARDNRIPGHWITVPKSCLRHGAAAIEPARDLFFQESPFNAQKRHHCKICLIKL